MFSRSVNKLLEERDEIFANLETVKETLFDNTALDADYADLQSEMAVVAEIIQKCVDENSRIAQSQDEYRQRYDGLVNRFETAKARFAEVNELRQENKDRRDMVNAFLGTLKTQDKLIKEFDKELWFDLVDKRTVNNDNNVQFIFKDGTEIQI